MDGNPWDTRERDARFNFHRKRDGLVIRFSAEEWHALGE